MATIAQLIADIEERLALASGLDVQIHAEDRIVAMIKHKYRILVDDHWWDHLMADFSGTLDGTTGQVTGDLSAIKQYADIQSIYLDTDVMPLPKRSLLTNPSQIKAQCQGPSTNATKVFKVYPIDTSGSVYGWYRQRLADSAWEDTNTDIPIDEELIILGCCADFTMDDGSNQQAAQKFMQMYNSRLSQLRGQEMNGAINKRQQEQAGAIQTDWV